MRPKRNIIAQAVLKAGIAIDITSESDIADKEDIQSVLTTIYPTIINETATTTSTSKSETVESINPSDETKTISTSISEDRTSDPTKRIPTKPSKISLSPKALTATDKPCRRKQNEMTQAKGLEARATFREVEQIDPKSGPTISISLEPAPVQKKSRIPVPFSCQSVYPLSRLRYRRKAGYLYHSAGNDIT